jgi:hypothetical protein
MKALSEKSKRNRYGGEFEKKKKQPMRRGWRRRRTGLSMKEI